MRLGKRTFALTIGHRKRFGRMKLLSIVTFRDWLVGQVGRGRDCRICTFKMSMYWEFSLWLSRLQTQLVSMRLWVQSLALLSGLRIPCCPELRFRLQLRSGVAVAVV